MAQKTTDDEWRAFVSYGTRTGKLSTVRADGSPHVTPIWFVLDGDEVVFNTAGNSVKGRNLAQDGRVALCVDDDRPPYGFVLLEGRARLSADPDEVRRWAPPVSAPGTWGRSGLRSSAPAMAYRASSWSASRSAR
jgi:PPOX class probable F420-dependent enzyme